MKNLNLSALAFLLLSAATSAFGICCDTATGRCCGPRCGEQCNALTSFQPTDTEVGTFNLSKSGTRSDDEGFGTAACKPLRFELEGELSEDARERCNGDFHLVGANFSCRRPKMNGNPLDYVLGNLTWTVSCPNNVSENEVENVSTEVLGAGLLALSKAKTKWTCAAEGQLQKNRYRIYYGHGSTRAKAESDVLNKCHDDRAMGCETEVDCWHN